MNRYRVRYWDSVMWCWRDATLLADCEQQCREWADAQLHPDLRIRHVNVGDSLQILPLGAVAIPYVVDYNES